MIMRFKFLTGILIAATLAATGCVSQEPVQTTASLCPPGLTYSCSSKVGKIQKCTCASREDLKAILDPVNDY